MDRTTQAVTPMMFTTVFRSTFPQFAETNNEGHWMQVGDKRSAEMEQDNAAKWARHDSDHSILLAAARDSDPNSAWRAFKQRRGTNVAHHVASRHVARDGCVGFVHARLLTALTPAMDAWIGRYAQVRSGDSDDAGGSDSLAVVSHCSCACVL